MYREEHATFAAALPAAAPAPRTGRPLIGFNLAGLLLVALGALGPLALLFSHVGRDYGEGWNAYWTMVAMHGGQGLYPVGNPWVANNYPPLSYYVVGFFTPLVGDPIFAARLVALGAVLACAALVAAIIRQLGAGRGWALGGALLLLAFAELPFGTMFALDNPQWLAEAQTLAALWLLTRPAPRLPHFALAALLIVTSLVTKHNLLALPPAVALWLWRRDRRAALAWCLGGAMLGGLAIGLVHHLFGLAVFVEVMGFARTVDPQNWIQGALLLILLAPLGGAAWWALGGARPDPRWRLLATYAVLALINGTLQHEGAGVAVNSHFEAMAVLVVLAMAALGTRRPMAGPVPGWPLALIALPVLVCAAFEVGDATVPLSLETYRDAPRERQEWARLIGDVRAAPGPVLCEQLAPCFWAGRPFALDFFAYGQKLRTGEDPRPLMAQIMARRPALLVLDRPPGSPLRQTRLPAPFMAAIRANYHVVRQLDDGITEWAPDRAPPRHG